MKNRCNDFLFIYLFIFFFTRIELREINLDDTFAAELDSLRRILHFPEEAALLIGDKENDLFYDIPPLDYLRQVTLDQDGANVCNTSVKKLIDRFNAVRIYLHNMVQHNNAFYFN